VKASFVGYYAQDLKPSGRDGLRGYSLFIGPSTAFQVSHRPSGAAVDAMGIVNILGPTLDLTVHQGKFRVRMVIDVYGDFAAIRAFALDGYEPVHGVDGVKSVLKLQRYHYAFGLSANTRIEAEYGPFSGGVAGSGGWYESIEGLDREQTTVDSDVHGTEAMAALRGWVAYRLPGDFSIKLEAERRWRYGSLGDVSASQREDRVLGTVIKTY
jgi:hypothetical protein